jgi:metal-responsive CopG/Arc/MetJ family transcriptional regulator
LWVNTVVCYITFMAVNSETTVRKLVSLPREMVGRIEEFRFSNRIKTESEAIRRLIEAGLSAQPKGQ